MAAFGYGLAVGPEQYQNGSTTRYAHHVTEPGDPFAEVGAEVLQELWTAAGAAPILVATGSTPMPIYAQLGRRVADGDFDVPASPIVQLDEYVGVDDADPRSLYGWMKRGFLAPLGIDEGRAIRLRGDVEDPAAESARFEEEVRSAGGIGIAVLGLGPNGHLGFNEPPCAVSAVSRVVPLTPESLVSNAAYWDGRPVPTHALTAGMTLILDADVVVLVVGGAHKRAVLEQALLGPESDDNPASHLRRAGRLIVVADDAAASVPLELNLSTTTV